MSQGTNLGSQKGRWIILAALVAVLGALLFLLPGGLAQAQQAQQSFTYAENATGPVATFAATDPEGVTPIVWSLLTDAMNEQNLGIFTDVSDPLGEDDSDDDVDVGDIADNADFAISQSGVLTFKSPPDYEDPTDREEGSSPNVVAVATDRKYHVVVQASDGGVGSFVNWFKVTVTVTDEEEAGAVAEWVVDADGVSPTQTPDKLLQFQPEATLTVVAPTDSDGEVTNVRWQWYRTSSKSEMGTAIDDADEATYTVSDTSTSNDVGMYLRVVATYSDRRGPNKTASYVSENPVQAARDDNTPPEFALTVETRVIAENTTGNVGSPLTATDDDGDILTYSLVGAADDNDNNFFDIDRATGQLVVGDAGLNFEMPRGELLNADSNTNTYVVMVRATDSHGVSSDTAADISPVTVTITVTDVNEAPTFEDLDDAPVEPLGQNTEGMAADHQEKYGDEADEELNVASYSATDPEGAVVTLSLMGDDADKFELNDPATVTAGTKVLAFKERPDFEMPGDGNGDNVYVVTVRATDDVLYSDRTVTVKVTDADEAGEVELSSQDAMIGVELTAELNDSDGGAPDPARFIDQVWIWQLAELENNEQNCAAVPTDVGNAERWTKAGESDAYTPKVSDRGNCLRAVVTYTDRTRDEDNVGTNNGADASFVGFTNTATSDSTTAVRNNPSNQRPVFEEGSRAVRLVEENTEALTDPDDDDTEDNPADNVGGLPVVAMDADGQALTYTLGGADKEMFRVRANGQIEVSDEAELDYETSRSHTVTLTADDGTGESNATASITVAIHVTDLDEKPTITDKGDSNAIGEQTVRYLENSTGPVIRLAAKDPEGVTPIVWSLLRVDDDATQDLGIFPADDDDVGSDDIADHLRFDISQNGELTFLDPNVDPDFEAAEKSASGDNNYRVVVQASDGGMAEHLNWFKVTVTVTNVDEDGTLEEWRVDANGDGTVQMPSNLLQFQPEAILLVALPMDDEGVRNIQWQWYRSPSKTATGTPIDATSVTQAGTTYAVRDSPAESRDVGSYLRVVATYDDSTGTGQTASFVSKNEVQAERREDNLPPEFSAAVLPRSIWENTVGNVGPVVTATDPDTGGRGIDADILTYSILIPTNGDNDQFTIDRTTGQLMVAPGVVLDFEEPTDVAGDEVTLPDGNPDTALNNVYVVTVTATDSSGGSDVVTVAITVTDLNEAPEFENLDAAPVPTPPENTEGMAADHPEKFGDEVAGELNVASYSAVDPEGAVVTLSLRGDDADKFELNDLATPIAGTKVLAFKERPDFEARADRNGDNVYVVAVRASDDVLNFDRTVTVKVTDVDEPGEVKLPQNAEVGIALTAVLTDSDGGAPSAAQFIDQVWSWYSLATEDEVPQPDAETEQTYNGIADAASPSYTPTLEDSGRFLKARVSYTDRTRDEDNDPETNDFVGFMNEVTSEATKVLGSSSNQPPVFEEGSRAVRLVEENTKALSGAVGEDDADDDAAADDAEDPADNVGGGPVTATDPEGGVPTYTLSGSDMFRVRNNGQIEVSNKADLDYETKSSHTVMLTATDTSGAANNSASIEVTIYVTDLDERPVITEGVLSLTGPMGSQEYPENGTEAVGIYTMDGPKAIGATMELMGDDAGDLTLEGSGMSRTLKFASIPNFEMPMDMDEDNEYKVTVMVRKGEFMVMADLTVVVTDVDELGTLAGEASLTYAEDRTDAVGTYAVSGGTMDDTATWTLEGTDAGDFDITGGVLTFNAAPDYENPMGGANNDANTYMVTVKASAGGEMAMMEVSITVDNADEEGMVTLSPMSLVVGTEVTASLSDPDGGETRITWQWSSADTMDGPFSGISGATLASYTPVEDDADMFLQATATYEDVLGTGKTASSEAVKVSADLADRYDTDGTPGISITELFSAIDAYFAGGLTIAELFELIDAYFASNG